MNVVRTDNSDFSIKTRAENKQKPRVHQDGKQVLTILLQMDAYKILKMKP